MVCPVLVVKDVSGRAGNQTQEGALSIMLFERSPKKPVFISSPTPRPRSAMSLFFPLQISNEETLKGKVLFGFSRKHLTVLPYL